MRIPRSLTLSQHLYLALLLAMIISGSLSSCVSPTVNELLPGIWEVVDSHTEMSDVNPLILREADHKELSNTYGFVADGNFWLQTPEGTARGNWEYDPADSSLHLSYLPEYSEEMLSYSLFLKSASRRKLLLRQEYTGIGFTEYTLQRKQE